jgi:hypothetical protein
MKIFDTSSLISIFGEAKYPKILTNCTERGYKSNKLREITRESPDKSIDYFDSKKCVSKDDIKQLRR